MRELATLRLCVDSHLCQSDVLNSPTTTSFQAEPIKRDSTTINQSSWHVYSSVFNSLPAQLISILELDCKKGKKFQ